MFEKLRHYFIDQHLLGQPAYILLGGLFMLTAECLFRDWHDTALYRLTVRRSSSAKIDVFSHLIQFLGLAFFLEVIFSFGMSIGASRLATYASQQLSWARINLPADTVPQIAGSFLIYYLTDHFVGYWVHRLYHTRLFWHLHRFHHSAPELNFITFYRVHPAETLTRVLFFISPLTILNAPDKVLMVALTVNIFLNYCQHSQMPKSWGWIGRWIFGSPGFHQLHHSIDAEHRDKNFCSCPLWDRVFGTWHDDRAVPSAYGISTADGPDFGYDQAPLRTFWNDTVAFYRDLVVGVLTPFRTKPRATPVGSEG
jgi:sterol desaturase/sphingolipid hydroxylase (fatty acid hydroxylase superfamily)